MPKQDQTKQKLLAVRELLETRSDEAHPLTVQQILDALARRGISAERKSIYADIACLQDAGMDILHIKGRGGGYYLASRLFELPELKLLVDAVQASRFLTERKSMQLIAKLETLASVHEAVALRRQVTVAGRVKTMNESIFYNVDRLHEAIRQNSRITFRYFDWDLDGSRRYRPDVYEASPYALIWQDENYYLIARSARHGLTHFRVDKMARITPTGKPRELDAQARELDLSRYGRSVFGMYGGQTQRVRLRFDRALTGVVIDRFGRDVMLIPDGPDAFIFTAEIAVSPNFFGWLAGFGARAQILSPEPVRAEFLALCRAAAAPYACAEACAAQHEDG